MLQLRHPERKVYLDVMLFHDVLDERRREVIELDDVVFRLVGAGWREETLRLLGGENATSGVTFLCEELWETLVLVGRNARPVDSLRQTFNPLFGATCTSSLDP